MIKVKNNQLIYISNPIESAVVESQVYALLQYYKNINAFENIVLIQVYNNDASYKLAKNILKKYDFHVEFIKGSISILIKINPFYFRLKKLLKLVIKSDDFIIHIRTELVGYYAINILNNLKLPLNILIDVRGVFKEELEFRINEGHYNTICNHQIILIFLYERIFNVFKKYKIYFSTVSITLKKYLIDKGVKSEISVNSNIANENFVFSIRDRHILRKKLGINDEKIVIVLSSSGNDSWQSDKSVVNHLIKDDNLIILNLSKEEIINKNVINMYLPFHEMPKFLSVADIAIVWRDKNLLNACASPSKFSEFAAMGLFIVHNNSVDLISDYIRKNNHGILLDDISQFKFSDNDKLKDNNRLIQSEIGRKTFGVERISKSYQNLYANIKKSNKL